MREISIGKGLFTFVDDEDFEELNKHKWSVTKGGRTYYVAGSRCGSMHRFIMREKLINAPKGMQIDHIDRNGLNNQKSNLRVVCNRENQNNVDRKKSSKYPGVSWSQSNKKWQASFYCNGRQNHLGYYDKEEDAFAEYKKIARIVDRMFINPL